ncbi:DUF2690 domain-containing protein [Streptomyces sp. BV129]|uniref:DUF2690 domain-containing protein n=1 Tax=Streptomyces sp. BV129 TaxID=2849671 RepID=UPI001C2EDDEC|nr:DUF2690 domain-containing protein [Streptomyces sp. BV129]MBV1947118.1 YjfA family protein [Streptomyces sp. BV129]
MKSIRTWTVAAVAVLSLFGSGTVSSEAVTAAGCRGSACDGKNPHTTGCDKGATDLRPAIRGEGGPGLHLRVSSRCSAAWVLFGKGDDAWEGWIQIRKGGSYPVHASPSRPAYSLMVGTSHAYRACKKNITDDGRVCGAWH